MLKRETRIQLFISVTFLLSMFRRACAQELGGSGGKQFNFVPSKIFVRFGSGSTLGFVQTFGVIRSRGR